MREISEPDWKVLRRVHPLALERFCERVLAEIDRVSHNSAKSHSSRYLEIFKIIEQRNREMASIFDDPRRSYALTMLAQIRSQGLLTEDEFSRLSPETRSAIKCCWVSGEVSVWPHGSRFSTSTVFGSGSLVPWLAAQGPLGLQPRGTAGDRLLFPIQLDPPGNLRPESQSARAPLLRQSPQEQRALSFRILGKRPQGRWSGAATDTLSLVFSRTSKLRRR